LRHAEIVLERVAQHRHANSFMLDGLRGVGDEWR
jgi:hypothetical protein